VAANSPPQPPSLREGGASAKRDANQLERGGWLLEHELVRETEHGDASASEEGVADAISSVATAVRVAVQLDGELGSGAEQVGEVGADWELPPEEKVIQLSPSDQGPELTLRQGRAPAMFASEDDASRKSPFHAMYVDTSESQLRGIDTDLRDLMVAA
jgi:hypothetical protein